ncbi:hypothetical protein L7F22_036611 [Adiantum nelumboides]|nr:hypothetical protein [Adiantum nelumboides]
MLRQRVLFEDKNLLYCSRYQALVALLWKARARSLLGNGYGFTSSQKLPIRLPVNLRERILPTLTKGYMGNGMCPTTASASMQELLELPLSILVHKIKAALDVVTPEFLQSRVDYLESRGLLEVHPNRFFFGMSSHVSLPFYDTDCGWGRPVYHALPSQQWNNGLYILEDLTKGSWNISVVLGSKEEGALFVGVLEDYVAVSVLT